MDRTSGIEPDSLAWKARAQPIRPRSEEQKSICFYFYLFLLMGFEVSKSLLLGLKFTLSVGLDNFSTCCFFALQLLQPFILFLNSVHAAEPP